MSSSSVSVVIPAYNAKSYIVEAIESVRRQDAPPTELVVVDDGSTDGTGDMVNAWVAANLPSFPVHVVRQANGGLPAARNSGIKRASSEWIALLDADDIWEVGHLSALHEAVAAAPQVVAAYGAGRVLVGTKVNELPYDEFWDNPSQTLGRAIANSASHFKIDFGAFGRLVKGNFIKPSSLMFRRQTAISLGVFDERLRTAEDREFLVRLLRAGDFVYTSTPITQYRWHEDNISQGKNARRNTENNLRALKIIQENTTLQLSASEAESCRREVMSTAAGYLYLSAREGWRKYRDAVVFLFDNFGWRSSVAAFRLRHVLKLLLHR